MTDDRDRTRPGDLSTLLDVAARQPTVDVDVHEVHDRGRRRRVGRRVGTWLGAMAVVGALGVGLASLVGQPSTPFVADESDAQVVEEASELRDLLELDPQPGGSTSLNVAPAVVAEAADVALMAAVWQPDGDAFEVTWTDPDGWTTTHSVASGTVASGPEVASDGALWWTGSDGVVRRADPLTGEVAEVLAAAEPFAWTVVGVTADAPEVVVSLAGPSGEPAPGGQPRVGTLHPNGDLAGLQVIGIEELAADGRVVDAHVTSSHVVVTVERQDAGGRQLQVHHGPLRGPLVEVHEGPVRTEEPGSEYLGGAAVVGDEVWLLLAPEPTGPSDQVRTAGVVRFPTDPGRASSSSSFTIPAPLTDSLVVQGLRASPNGRVVLVQMEDLVTDGRATLAIFPAALSLVEDPASSVRIVDAPGLVAAFRPQGDRGEPGPATPVRPTAADQQACVSDTANRNAPPADGDHVWFACYGDTGSDAFPFHRVRIADVHRGDGDAVLGAIVQRYLDGPAAAARAAGVTALAPVGQVELTGVRLRGGRATIDVGSTGDIGVPTGAADGQAFRVGLAAAALQVDGVEEVVTVTDGVCGDWEGTQDPDAADDCIVWTVDDMPWNQSGD